MSILSTMASWAEAPENALLIDPLAHALWGLLTNLINKKDPELLSAVAAIMHKVATEVEDIAGKL